MKTATKIRSVIGAGLLAALPSLVLAGPPTNTDMARGEIEGILEFCISADPAHAKDLEKEITALTRTLSPPGARGTAAYRQGYDYVTDALVRLAKGGVVSSCASIVSDGKEHGERGEQGEDKEKGRDRPESDRGRR